VRLRDIGQYIVFGLLLILIVSLVFGQALGQPILLGYVETGSMQPVLEPGDGFIAIPSDIAGSPDIGDVVVYRAEEIQGGGLTTHRIVGKTEAGYITQGDANPFPDQDGVEPPVSRSQIVAHALQVNGNVVVIPGIGGVVGEINSGISSVAKTFHGVSGFGPLTQGEATPQSLIALGISVVIVNFLIGLVQSNSERQKRSRRRSGHFTSAFVLLILVSVIVLPATASMVLGTGSTTLDIVSSESPNDRQLVMSAGEVSTIDYTMSNNGFVPVMVVLESGHSDVAFSQPTAVISPQTSKVVDLTIRAPSETGAYQRTISRYRYLPVLPDSIILDLHTVHPYLAIAVINGVLLLFALILSIIAIGLGDIRIRSERRNITLRERIKRRFF